MASDLLGEFFRRSRQRRVATGFGLNSAETSGAIDAALANERAMADQSKRYEAVNRELSIREQSQKDAQFANKISGFGQLAQLPISYMAAKSLFGGSGGGGGAQAQVVPNLLKRTVAQPPVTSEYFPDAAAFINANTSSGGAAVPASAPASTGMGLLGAGGTAAALYAAQYLSGKAMQPTMDKIGLPTAGKGWTIGGLPGAMAGGAYDVIHKIASVF